VQAEEDKEAEVDITLQTIPGIRVARGAVLAYKMRIENHGDETTAYARATLPYDPGYMTVFDAQFENDSDYVYRLEENKVVVHFGVVGKDTSRYAVIFMRVADWIPNDTALNMIVSFDWEDENGNYGLDHRSNSAPVLIGDYNVTSEYVWAAVSPAQAPAGAQIGFYSDRFVPDERVEMWLQWPDGTRERLSSDLWQTVDHTGRVWLHYDETGGLPPGDYKMILRGEESELKAAPDFSIIAP
jgi:hypothetical protein